MRSRGPAFKAHIDNAEELKEQKKPELVIPPTRDWDKDGSTARDYATRASMPMQTTGERSLDDRVLYLGMTDSAATELAALRATGATVIAVEHRASIDGRDFDLSKPAQALAYAYTIGLKDEQAESVAKIIASSPELASIARAWAPGENGGLAPSRLALSGHSAGPSVYGPNGDEVQFGKVCRHEA